METSNVAAITEEPPQYLLLCVEDDATAREFLMRAIVRRFANIRVMEAENGSLGLELSREHHPDIVLTDVNMPVMDGLTMAGLINEMHSPAVIVVSGRCTSADFVSHAQAAGIRHFVHKPVDVTSLFAAIEECCRQCTIP